MIALDTNVLVRFVVEDDPDQSARARALVESAIEEEGLCHISEVVFCELVWVLRSSYRLAKSELIEVLKALQTARQLAFAAPDRLSSAIRSYAAGRGDFADYLILEHARAAGCASVATFDRALIGEAGFSAA